MVLTWDMIKERANSCQACGLCGQRTNVVFGEGNESAKLMFVGEGPGREEDLKGRPFVGAAGQLLDKMLASIELSRQDVYIANIVKCRPPNNREPNEYEANCCLPILRAQTALIRPKIIVCLGRVAAQNIIDPSIRITKERGKITERKGVKLMATYHPAALLRDEAKKRDAWEDMKAIKNMYLTVQ